MIMIVHLRNILLDRGEAVPVTNKLNVIISVNGDDKAATVICISSVENQKTAAANRCECAVIIEFGSIHRSVGRAEGHEPIGAVKDGVIDRGVGRLWCGSGFRSGSGGRLADLLCGGRFGGNGGNRGGRLGGAPAY